MQWAVLIGVDFYPHGKCLNGSVNDVSAVKTSLESADPPADITLFTVPNPLGAGCTEPLSNVERRLTKQNLVSALKRVINESRPGDFVYFHYSGHGIPLRSSGKYAHSRGNLALEIPCDESPYSEYFRGQNLGAAFNQMVQKGLLVTVVLDCCSSGSVFRDDAIGPSIREAAYNPAIEAAHPSDVDIFPDPDVKRSTLRPDQWLMDPNGYTILAACGPHETAQELKDNITGCYHGALSYFLMKALASLGNSAVPFTHQSLYSHLRIMFQASWPHQTPMIYGKSDRSMFGRPGVQAIRAAISPSESTGVFWVPGEHDLGRNHLRLNAGEAHRVRVGDEFRLYPSRYVGMSEQSSNVAPTTVKVTAVTALSSTLIGIGPDHDLSHIKGGWWAVKKSSSRRKIPVGILSRAASLLDRTDSNPADYLQRSFCQQSPVSNSDPPACLFNVDLDSSEENFEILDARLERVPNIPIIPAFLSSKNHLWSILEHITTYKSLEQLEKTPTPDFKGGFAIRALSVASLSGADDNPLINIQHGHDLTFSVENLTDKPLYLALLNFCPTWEVSNLLWESGSGEFHVLQPRTAESPQTHTYRNEERITLMMKIPDEFLRQGQKTCIECFKFFVTTKATSFSGMILPDIAEHRWQHHEERATDVKLNDDGVWEALESLMTTFKPLRDREPSAKQTEPENWAIKSFLVQISLDCEDTKM